MLAPLALAALLAIPVGTVKATGSARVIWDKETDTSTRASSRRATASGSLELNEGQAIHSVYRPGEWLTGDYWDEMLVLPFAGRAGAAAVGRDPRQRRRDDRARVRPLLPAHARRRGRDRRRADRVGRACSTSAARTSTRTRPTRGPFLRRSTRRWTSSSSTPTASRTSRSTSRRGSSSRSRASTSRPGGMVVVTSGTRALGRAGEGADARRWAPSSRTVLRDPSEPTNTMLVGTDAPASAGAMRGALGGCPRRCGRSRGDRRGGSRHRCAGGACTPMTWRRSSG